MHPYAVSVINWSRPNSVNFPKTDAEKARHLTARIRNRFKTVGNFSTPRRRYWIIVQTAPRLIRSIKVAIAEPWLMSRVTNPIVICFLPSFRSQPLPSTEKAFSSCVEYMAGQTC